MTGRRIALLLFLLTLGVTALTAGTAGTGTSGASYTTTSETDLTASAATAGDWLQVFSQATDPDGLTGYARQNDLASQPFIAGGAGVDLKIDWGRYDDLNLWFTFSRVLTIKTPTTFPDPTVTQVTVTATLIVDPGGTQPLRKPDLHLVNQAGTTNRVVLGTDQRAQLDIQLRTKKNPWDAGDEFHPRVVLTLTYAGGPADYYVYDFTTELTII